MAVDNDPNVLIESGGNTFNVATDAIVFSGATSHFQYMKVAFGPTGSATIVSNSSPFPVSVIGGGITANITGFSGAVQGIPGGTPVTVSGTVYTTGVTTAPVFVRTSTGYQVEITGGTPLSRTKDSVSIWGPNGTTWAYVNLVNSSGTEIGNAGNPIFVQISGATINATINPTVGVTNTAATGLFIRGITGSTPVPVSLGSTYFSINDTAILSGMTAIYSKVNDVYNALGAFGLIRPSGLTTGILTNITTVGNQLSTAGYTCSSGINFKASSSNTDLIYIGNSTIATTLGFMLDPGEQLFLDIDNISKVYVRSKSGTQVLSYIAT